MAIGQPRYDLGSRAVRAFYGALEIEEGKSWIDKIAMRFDSDQKTEEYAWLSASPALREWIGGRQAVGLSANKISIESKSFEGTLAFPTDDIRRDKTGSIDIRIADLARRTIGHWAKLLSTLIINGTGSASGLCYDGQNFFDTDHSEGDSGTQLNLLAAGQVAALHVATPTAPTPLEAAMAVLGAIAYMLGYLDDKGEPLNEMARAWLVMTGTTLGPAFSAAVSQKTLGAGVDNPLVQQRNFEISHVINPRMAALTTQFIVFRTDAPTKPFIRQEELFEVEVVGPGSEHEFKNNEELFGVKLVGNVGYGLWSQAAHAILS
jgi:phage major head subunit gpT-like protein